jgi:hypothetical protein
MARRSAIGVAAIGHERIAALRAIAAYEEVIAMPAASNQSVHDQHGRCQVGYKRAHENLATLQILGYRADAACQKVCKSGSAQSRPL